jgi:hypothetical protein
LTFQSTGHVSVLLFQLSPSFESGRSPVTPYEYFTIFVYVISAYFKSLTTLHYVLYDVPVLFSSISWYDFFYHSSILLSQLDVNTFLYPVRANVFSLALVRTSTLIYAILIFPIFLLLPLSSYFQFSTCAWYYIQNCRKVLFEPVGF